MQTEKNPKKYPSPDAQGEGEPANLAADLRQKLTECRRNIELLEKELETCRKRASELEKGLLSNVLEEKESAPEEKEPVFPEKAPEPDEDETEGDKYLASVHDRIREIIRAEMDRLDKEPGAAPKMLKRDTMVCPSCGAIVGRMEESCPQCRSRTEAEGEGGRRVFPLSAEKFLYVFNDRFGWFIRTFDKAMHLADRKNEYEQAADVLMPVIQFMEENIDLLKSKHRDFKLALAYAYLGRSLFQSGKHNEAIENYKKGVMLKASNSYNCEIGMIAVYRNLVRQIREAKKPLKARDYPALGPAEIEQLNALGLSSSS